MAAGLGVCSFRLNQVFKTHFFAAFGVDFLDFYFRPCRPVLQRSSESETAEWGLKKKKKAL